MWMVLCDASRSDVYSPLYLDLEAEDGQLQTQVDVFNALLMIDNGEAIRHGLDLTNPGCLAQTLAQNIDDETLTSASCGTETVFGASLTRAQRFGYGNQFLGVLHMLLCLPGERQFAVRVNFLLSIYMAS
jgi:hypothetical protein